MAGGLSKYIDDNLADSRCGYLVLIFVFWCYLLSVLCQRFYENNPAGVKTSSFSLHYF